MINIKYYSRYVYCEEIEMPTGRTYHARHKEKSTEHAPLSGHPEAGE